MSFFFREKVTLMSQNNLDPNATNTEVTDTEILTFYNLATMTLLTSLEVRNEINATHVTAMPVSDGTLTK